MSTNNFVIDDDKLPENWANNWKDVESAGGTSPLEYVVYRSNVSLCLRVKLTIEPEAILGVAGIAKDFLRDQALELLDWNLYAGYALPLICVIVFEGEAGPSRWKSVSGDQEWLRGQLSIQVVQDMQEAARRLGLLLTEALPLVEKPKSIDDRSLARAVAKGLETSRELWIERRTLLEQIVRNLNSPSVEIALAQWERDLVVDYENILEGTDV